MKSAVVRLLAAARAPAVWLRYTERASHKLGALRRASAWRVDFALVEPRLRSGTTWRDTLAAVIGSQAPASSRAASRLPGTARIGETSPTDSPRPDVVAPRRTHQRRTSEAPGRHGPLAAQSAASGRANPVAATPSFSADVVRALPIQAGEALVASGTAARMLDGADATRSARPSRSAPFVRATLPTHATAHPGPAFTKRHGRSPRTEHVLAAPNAGQAFDSLPRRLAGRHRPLLGTDLPGDARAILTNAWEAPVVPAAANAPWLDLLGRSASPIVAPRSGPVPNAAPVRQLVDPSAPAVPAERQSASRETPRTSTDTPVPIGVIPRRESSAVPLDLPPTGMSSSPDSRYLTTIPGRPSERVALDALAHHIQRILDDEARRHGIDV